MLHPYERLGTKTIKKKKGGGYTVYIHSCKSCGKEMLKNRTTEKRSIGLCKPCFSTERRKVGKSDENGCKKCTKCKLVLKEENFFKNKSGLRQSRCTMCINFSKFGINRFDYEIMFKKQNGLCAICNKPEFAITRKKKRMLSVDHCHKTGKVRGLLCGNCNIGIGLFKENKESLWMAIKYLETKK